MTVALFIVGCFLMGLIAGGGIAAMALRVYNTDKSHD